MFCKNCGNEIDDKAVICPQCGVKTDKAKVKKSIFKKWWFWVLIVVVVAIIAGSAGGESSDSSDATIESKPSSTTVEKDETSSETDRVIKQGEKIVTKEMEVAINSVELTYDVLPDDTSGFYTHYEADSGKVYICVDADVTNKAKQNLACDEIGKVIADYNDGYTYSGFAIVDDSTTGFAYANITNINPLETKGIKWLIECPQEVEESENSLFLEFTIKGEKYIYTIR